MYFVENENPDWLFKKRIGTNGLSKHNLKVTIKYFEARVVNIPQ